MIGIIEFIFAVLGMVGIFTDNIVLILLGLIIVCICDFIDIFVEGHNPISIIIALIGATIASIIYKNPLYSFTIFICGENIIMTLVTLFIMFIPKKEKTYANAWEERMDTLYSNKKKGTFLKDVKLKKQ